MDEENRTRLERLVADWRRGFLSHGAQPVVVDELEDHLRVEIQSLVARGQTPEVAFADATKRIGEPDSLSADFRKVAGPRVPILPGTQAELSNGFRAFIRDTSDRQFRRVVWFVLIPSLVAFAVEGFQGGLFSGALLLTGAIAFMIFVPLLLLWGNPILVIALSAIRLLLPPAARRIPLATWISSALHEMWRLPYAVVAGTAMLMWDAVLVTLPMREFFRANLGGLDVWWGVLGNLVGFLCYFPILRTWYRLGREAKGADGSAGGLGIATFFQLHDRDRRKRLYMIMLWGPPLLICLFVGGIWSAMALQDRLATRVTISMPGHPAGLELQVRHAASLGFLERYDLLYRNFTLSVVNKSSMDLHNVRLETGGGWVIEMEEDILKTGAVLQLDGTTDWDDGPWVHAYRGNEHKRIDHPPEELVLRSDEGVFVWRIAR